MTQISGPEVKYSLRKMDYPLCAKEALIKIGQLICNRVPSLKHMDLALDLMSELIFCEVDRRGNKRNSALSPLCELQLLEVLYDYLNDTTNETSRNAVFLSLFSGTTAMMRSAVLSKLISLAVGIPSPALLVSASTWMQQLGNTSPNSHQLAKALVQDYFILSPKYANKLHNLPHVAPQFTANFLTAVANIYFTDGKKEPPIFPPLCLLETITLWITENSGLCIAAQQSQSSLPPGAIAMEATTPLADLLKWSILAPLFIKNNEELNLYGQLHLGLLNSILDVPATTPPRAISSQHLIQPIGSILRYVMQSQTKSEKGDTTKQKLLLDDNLQLCLDRFAHAVQVSLTINCIYGNIEDLFGNLLQLPQNRAMKIVISTYLQNKYKSIKSLLDKWPGKKYLGEYRFLPIFFVLGAALEFSMINWKVGDVNFYNTFKRRQAKDIIDKQLREDKT